MFERHSAPSNVVDQAASAANKGIAATQHALDGLAGGVQTLRNEVSPRLDSAAEHASAIVHRGVEAVREGSQRLRAKAHEAGEGTTHYIQHEPVKSMLIAAATGAVLMALMSLAARSRGHA